MSTSPYRCIPLTQGQYAFVDESDFDELNQYPWFARWNPEAKTYYASRSIMVRGKQRTIHMHNVVVPPPRGKVIDHWNGHGLDNRRVNLRSVTSRVNAINRKVGRHNTSGCKGVHQERRSGQWVARISVNDRRISLGHHKRKKDAIAARLAAEKRYYKDAVRDGAPEVPPLIVDPNVKRALRVRNTSGFKGVGRKRKGWRARVKIDGIDKTIGHFDSPEKAAQAIENFSLITANRNDTGKALGQSYSWEP